MMGYTFKPNTGYLMPAHFGPVRRQDVLHYQEVTRLSIPYVTDKDALAALLPEPFEPADEPVVTLYCQVGRGVDFMAGGGYNIIGINLAAVFNGKKDHITGLYAAVLWENDTFPILIGRELLGAPKLYAEIPDPWLEGNNWYFYCSEYGTKLIEGEIKNATPAEDAVCRRIEQDARNSRWMCWKYYPRADWKGAELSFPTALPTRPTINQAWLGQGSFHFFETTWEKTPVSAHIMRGLQTLVIKEYKPAVITKGSLDLLIAETQRIE
jgi:hypothetical protein